MRFDPVAALFTGFFMLWVSLLPMPFLARKAGLKRDWIPISPWKFLVGSLGISGLSAGLALAAGGTGVLVGAALGIGIGLSLLHPVVAVSFFVANLLMRPWELVQTNALLTAMPRLLAAVTILSWVIHRLRARKASFVWGFGPTAFVALFGWIALSIALSPTLDVDMPILTALLPPIAVVSLLILNSVDAPEDLELLKSSITLAVAGLTSTAIYLTVTSGTGGRLQGTSLLGNANDIGAVIALATPFPALALLRKGREFGGRAADLVCLGIFAAGLLLSQSRGAILSLAAAGFVYALIVSQSIGRTLKRMALIAPIPMLFMLAIDRDSGDMETSSDSRLNYMVTGFRMVLTSPVWGVGMNNYPRRYEQFTSVFHEWGERTAHSTWVLFMSETGFVGLALFCALYFTAFGRLWRHRKAAPDLVLAMVAYGVAMSFLSHSYTIFPYLLVFTALAAARILKMQTGKGSLDAA